jgi:hypothetical protein
MMVAMIGRMRYTSLRDAIFTHPAAAKYLSDMFATTPVRPE